MLRRAKLTNTLSIAFLSTPGTLWLYSGVTNRYASASAIFLFQARTIGSRVRGVGEVADRPIVSAKNGSGQSPQVDDLDVEVAVGVGAVEHPRDHPLGGPAGAGATDDDLELQHERTSGGRGVVRSWKIDFIKEYRR